MVTRSQHELRFIYILAHNEMLDITEKKKNVPGTGIRRYKTLSCRADEGC